MGLITEIKERVAKLAPEEQAELRAWFLERDWVAWHRQIEEDLARACSTA